MELGSHARDIISGFAGVITARSEFLFAGPDIRIQPTGLNDSGQPIEPLWFCENQCEPIADKNPVAGAVTE